MEPINNQMHCNNGIRTSACNRCASCSVSNVTKPYPLLTPARSTMIFVDFTFPYDENTRQSSASVVSPLQFLRINYEKYEKFAGKRRYRERTQITFIRHAYLIPPTKIRFGISVPYFGAANCASSCPFDVFVTAIVCICIAWWWLLLPFQYFSSAVAIFV